jgi:hypothetical protein
VVNAGGNTVSVFELDRATGDLTLRGQPVDSAGARPVSLSVQASGQEGVYWVAVGNQLFSPHVQLGGPGEDPIQFVPDRQTIEGIANGTIDSTDARRNLALFRFDVSAKSLTLVRVVEEYGITNGGPTCVQFSPDGTKLAVVTFGVPHLFTAQIRTEYQQPGRTIVYDFDKGTGATSNMRYYEEQGVAASIGFDWNPVPGRNLIYLTNGNLAEGKRDHGVMVLEAQASGIAKPQFFATGAGNGSTHMNGSLPASSSEDCWTAISTKGDILWVSSSAAAIVTTFDIDLATGMLTAVGPGPNSEFVQRPPGTPVADTKDMFPSPDGRFLYLIGSFESFDVVTFDISDTSPVLTLDNEMPVAAATPPGAGNFNFLGLTGYDLEKATTTGEHASTTEGDAASTSATTEQQDTSGAVGRGAALAALAALTALELARVLEA